MEAQLVKFDRDPNGNLTYEPFVVNGKTYRFIKPGDPIGIALWSEYQRLQIVVGGGVTFEQLIVGLREHKKLLSSDQPFSEIRSEAIVWADSQIKGLIELSQSRYHKAFYLASLFIYEDGTNPYEWDMDIANRRLSDWAAVPVDEKKTGPVDEQDLFFFAMLLIPAWNLVLNELSDQVNREAARSLVDILLHKMKGGA